MKRENLGYLLTGLGFFAMMSMTIDEGGRTNRISGSSGVHLTVPARPSATILVKGTDKMYEYLKKGYQVQQVADGASSQPQYINFLMVKY
jgi:hypothetical protein